MKNEQKKWIYLIILSLVWGSSFILMKKALISLSPIQVAALRTIIAAVFVIIVGHKNLKKIKKNIGSILFLAL